MLCLFDFASDLDIDFFRIVEPCAIDLLAGGFSYLAVHAGVSAHLGRYVVDSQAASQAPGRDRSKSNHLFSDSLADQRLKLLPKQ